jgi:hypothetical protein
MIRYWYRQLNNFLEMYAVTPCKVKFDFTRVAAFVFFMGIDFDSFSQVGVYPMVNNLNTLTKEYFF